jgi:hypothetical protein
VFNDYDQPADEVLVESLASQGQWAEAFEELARPLHEALYHAQTFDMLNELKTTERLILSLDYVQMQVGQGGFIQLIQNGYVSLLLTVIESAQELDIIPDIRKVLDDALKVFVLNNEALTRETTPQEFASLYEEFKEFDILDKAFEQAIHESLQVIVKRAITEEMR